MGGKRDHRGGIILVEGQPHLKVRSINIASVFINIAWHCIDNDPEYTIYYAIYQPSYTWLVTIIYHIYHSIAYTICQLVGIIYHIYQPSSTWQQTVRTYLGARWLPLSFVVGRELLAAVWSRGSGHLPCLIKMWITGWWLNPTHLNNMKVNWDDSSQICGKVKDDPNHQPDQDLKSQALKKPPEIWWVWLFFSRKKTSTCEELHSYEIVIRLPIGRLILIDYHDNNDDLLILTTIVQLLNHWSISMLWSCSIIDKHVVFSWSYQWLYQW